MRILSVFVIISWCLVTACTGCGIGLSFSWGGGGRYPYSNRPWYYDDYGMGFGGPRFTIGTNGGLFGGMSSNTVHHHHHHYYDKDGKYNYRYSKDPPPGSSGNFGSSSFGAGAGSGSSYNSPFWRFFSNFRR